MREPSGVKNAQCAYAFFWRFLFGPVPSLECTTLFTSPPAAGIVPAVAEV